MNALEAFTGGHRLEQTIRHQRQHVQVEQVVDQARAAVALGATLGEVIDEVLAVREIQLAAVQALAQTASLISISSRSTGPPTG